jgi:hypothetical protein
MEGRGSEVDQQRRNHGEIELARTAGPLIIAAVGPS